MVLSPEPPRIVEPTIVEGDYANQEVINKAAATSTTEGDQNNKIGTIRGSTPIRSRTLTPDQCDYINQEILDGDIIPVALAPPSGAAPVLVPNSSISTQTWERSRDYENLDKPLGEEQQKSVAVDQQNDIFADSKQVLQQPQQQQTLQTSPTLRADRRSMSPTDEGESALEFRANSPLRLTPELVTLKPTLSSGGSSGATTPGTLSLDSLDNFFDDDAPISVPETPPTDSSVDFTDSSVGFNRMAKSVYRPTGSDQSEVREGTPIINNLPR